MAVPPERMLQGFVISMRNAVGPWVQTAQQSVQMQKAQSAHIFRALVEGRGTRDTLGKGYGRDARVVVVRSPSPERPHITGWMWGKRWMRGSDGPRSKRRIAETTPSSWTSRKMPAMSKSSRRLFVPFFGQCCGSRSPKTAGFGRSRSARRRAEHGGLPSRARSHSSVFAVVDGPRLGGWRLPPQAFPPPPGSGSAGRRVPVPHLWPLLLRGRDSQGH